MAKAGVIWLIGENPKAHGVHDQTDRIRRRVLCTVKNVRQSEYYQAYNGGIEPEFQFNLTLAADWHGERLLEYRPRFRTRLYRIIRTYETPSGGLEIIAGREQMNGTDEEYNGDGTGNGEG